MDWSADAVLDYGARPHCRYQRGSRRHILWPAWAWRVVAPELRELQLNPLQRVILRLRRAGCRNDERVAGHLGLDRELVALIADEVAQMGLLDELGAPTEKGLQMLDESGIELGEPRVGWIFQNGQTGRLFPRFASTWPLAAATADERGYPRIAWGSKLEKSSRAFVMSPALDAPLSSPSPRDVLEAAALHQRHMTRHWHAGIDTGVAAPQAVEHVSFISETPQLVHLATSVYVPESESETHPWFVAEPFGFGASEELRDLLDRHRSEAEGSLRDFLEMLVGAGYTQHREEWEKMETLLRKEASARALRELPEDRGVVVDELRAALVEVFVELGRISQSERPEVTGASRDDVIYLRIRQALEVGLNLLYRRRPRPMAWKKVDELPRDASRELIRQCAERTGFAGEMLPRAIANAAPGQIQWVCTNEPGGKIRPTIASMLLAASDDQGHPLRAIAARHPTWISEVEELAATAGALVHRATNTIRNIKRIEDDVASCIEVVTSITEALTSAEENV